MFKEMIKAISLAVIIIVGVTVIYEANKYVTSDNYEWDLKATLFGSVNEKDIKK